MADGLAQGLPLFISPADDGDPFILVGLLPGTAEAVVWRHPRIPIAVTRRLGGIHGVVHPAFRQ